MDTSQNNPYSHQNQKKFDLKEEIGRYLRFWPWFLLALALALLIAYFNIRYTPKIYTTSSKIKILDKSDGIELPTSSFVFKNSDINLKNEIEILTSYRIIEQVVKSLNLNISFFEEGQIITTRLAKLPFEFNQLVHLDSIRKNSEYKIYVSENSFEILNTKNENTLVFPNHSTYNKKHNLPFELILNDSKNLSSLIDKTFIVKFKPLKPTVLNIKSKVRISTIAKSDLLSLSISSQNKDWSELVLNGLMDVFDKDGINDRQLVSKRTLKFIEDRFFNLALELDSIEISKKEFKQDNNLIELGSNAQIGLSKESQSEVELFSTESQIALTDLIIDALTADQDSQGLLPSNIGLNNGGISSLVNQYNATVLERNKYNVSGGSNNPIVRQLEATILDLKKNINTSLQNYKRELELSLKQLERRNIEFIGEVKKLPEKEKLLRAIERQQKIKENLYIFLLQKREEAAINLAITEPTVKIVEYPLSKSGPISPNSKNTYLIAVFVGLLIPFGVLYLIFMLNTKIHDRKDIEKIVSDIPIAGEIPLIKDKNNLIFKNPNDHSILAESFRILGSNVNYVLPVNGTNGKVIFCTSTIKGEGKTYVSANLSLALSSINKRVLLIGADLRNPQIHTYINKEKDGLGLSSFLHDTSLDWKTMLIKGFQNHTNHDVLVSGSIPPNPAHLMANGRFEQLIEEARQLYDYIIVDTTPTILVSDTMLISHLADATLYIVRADYTENELLKFSKELRDTGKLKNMVFVVNAVGSSKAKGYGYNYGYGYGYGNKT